jgi:hypothetical protein
VTNILQLSLPVPAAATCVPAAANWLMVPAPTGIAGTGNAPEFRNGAELIAPVTDRSGNWAHEAKAASRTEKQALVLTGSTTNQLDGYGFGRPVGVVAVRDGVATGIPPRSRPV